MFFIFKITPDWIWWLLPVLGLLAYCASYLPTAKNYALIIKSIGCATIAIGIFILGALYADNTWKEAAKELQAKVVALQAQSQVVNAEVKEKLVIKTQIVKTRGDNIIQYIDREVSDAGCTIPSEFVKAHNQAAEQPK